MSSGDGVWRVVVRVMITAVFNVVKCVVLARTENLSLLWMT